MDGGGCDGGGGGGFSSDGGGGFSSSGGADCNAGFNTHSPSYSIHHGSSNIHPTHNTFASTNVHHAGAIGQPRMTYVPARAGYQGNPRLAGAVCMIMFGAFFIIPGISLPATAAVFGSTSMTVIGIILLVIAFLLITTGIVLCCKYRNNANTASTFVTTTTRTNVVAVPAGGTNLGTTQGPTNVHPTTMIYQQPQYVPNPPAGAGVLQPPGGYSEFPGAGQTYPSYPLGTTPAPIPTTAPSAPPPSYGDVVKST